MNPFLISASRINKDVYCLSSPTAPLSKKVGFWVHGVGIHPKENKSGWWEVVKQRKWVICLLSFGYTLLWGLLGCYNTTGNLLWSTRVLPEVKKRPSLLEAFPSLKPQTEKIQLQLEDTWTLPLNRIQMILPHALSYLLLGLVFKRKEKLRFEVGVYGMII